MIEVCHARPERATVLKVLVEPGTTVAGAIEQSGILQREPGLSLADCGVGIFGRVCRLTDVLEASDRVEIYRPLELDPKDMRRRAARSQRQR